ncbi:MAG: hypothetical protein O7G87_10610 [bacterium]|nr:hypothetical protein [bacterium]
MKPAKPEKFKKIRKEDLREPPAWLKQAHESFKKGPLAHMSEKEIGQLSEDIAEEEAAKRQVSKGAH